MKTPQTPRRSIVPSITSTPHHSNDDEVERFKRRTNADIHRRISNIGALNHSSTSNNDVQQLSESKLNDHYQTCVKLFTENKLNNKNAWNVHIVDYVKVMISKKLSMKDVLKLASTSIDIGSKVYCLKVDDVHNDMFKLAGAMAQMKVNEALNDNSEDEENNIENEEENAAQKKKAKKKKKSRVSTDNLEANIAKNENTINNTIVPHNTACTNAGNSGKERLYTLSMTTKLKWGWEQMVSCRSNFKYWTPLKDNNDDDVINTSKKVPVCIPDGNGNICPSFMDFVINNWEPEDDVVPMGTQKAQNTISGEVVYDNNGLPIPELDVSVNGINDDDNENLFEEEVGVCPEEGLRRPVTFITDMRPGDGPLTDAPLQYSYRPEPVVNDRYMITGVWAGPAHWKIKCLQRPTVNSLNGNTNNTGVKRAKRIQRNVVEIISFLEEDTDDIDIEKLFEHADKTKRKKRNDSNSKYSLDEEESVHSDRKLLNKRVHKSLLKHVLPEDKFIDDKRNFICSMYSRKDKIISLMNSSRKNQADASCVNLNLTTNYVYDNPNDAEYCSQTLRDDYAGADDDHHSDDNIDAFHQTITDENLVNMPNMVQKIVVPYATQAKKIDMRKLKDSIWQSLAITETGDEKVLEKEEDLKNVKLNQISFSQIYKILPSYMSSRMSENLSYALAFVALLHLANENTLKIEGQTNLKDVLISTNKID